MGQFQAFVWSELPPRRSRLGREMVADIVALAVQEWPSELLSQCDALSAEETKALADLAENIKRQAQLLYGERKFRSLWIIALQLLLPLILEVILAWWRDRKVNRGKITLWRRHWKIDRE
jgi:hypothetical protein